MTLRQPKTIGTTDHTLARIQDNLVGVIHTIIEQPILDGVLLEGLRLNAGAAVSNIINHTLGRDLKGWILVRLSRTAGGSAFTQVWEMPVAAALRTKLMDLRCDAACTISIWVF